MNALDATTAANRGDDNEERQQSFNITYKDLPNLTQRPDKSDKSAKSDYCTVSNAIFINAVFGKLNGNLPITVTFKGDPSDKRTNWTGRAYFDGKTSLPEIHNNYVSMAIFSPEDGQYRRRKSSFTALIWVLLDDIGTKVDAERVTLAPSWIIETSKDNCQYGYILSEPISNASYASSLLDAIIAAGLSDPGANGATCRIGRLPVGINGKYPDTVTRLLEWRPELKYTAQEIIDGLQIELREKGRPKTERKTASDQNSNQDDDAVHIPRGESNPVIDALHKNNLYKQPLGSGKHDITCPWVNEHNDCLDHGTAYFEPSASYPLGGFKCLHGHCSHRHIVALLTALSIERKAAKHLPTIKITAGEMNRIVDGAEKELSLTGQHYQRGTIIVTVVTDPQTRATNVKHLTLPSLTRVVSTLAIWERFDKREMRWLTADPPEKHVKILHDATHYPHLPVLNGIARQPYLMPDGSICKTAGYDPVTGLFGVFNAKLFDIPDKPTRDHAEIALQKLTALLCEFCFKSGHDLSAALSGLLAASIRISLALCPMYHAAAPASGSGKGYLCELITLFCTPEKSTPHTFPSEDDELKKLLLAELLTAPEVIEFDNLTSDLVPHKSLCTALTSEYVSGRILGQSKTAEVSTRALFLSSGNNVEPVRDMTRRTVTIRLDPQCESPATREFKNNPVEEVSKKRGDYVSFALVIVRAWIVAGRPMATVKPLNSYSQWSDLCRQPLLWLGLKDPAQCVFDGMAHDPDREFLGRFLSIWHEAFNTKSATVKNLIEQSVSDTAVREIVNDIAQQRDGSVSGQKLGLWVKRNAGRVVDGMRINEDTSYKSNVTVWKLELLVGAKPDV